MSQDRERAVSQANRIVVVVDDDPRVRQALESLLSSADLEVRTHGSALAALQSGDLGAASCLITDIRMPEIDGWELLRRAADVNPSLPAIFVTAHLDGEAQRRALTGGAFAFFYKPFDGEALLRAVETAVQSPLRPDAAEPRS